jgi:hypothetical protein
MTSSKSFLLIYFRKAIHLQNAEVKGNIARRALGTVNCAKV